MQLPSRLFLYSLLLSLAPPVIALEQHPKRQSLPPFPSDFPKTVNLTQIELFLKGEYSNYATGPISNDNFYAAPKDSADKPPGAILKVEQNTTATRLFLSPATALSRFMYQSQNNNGTSVPATAFVLWPFTPRCVGDGIASKLELTL